MSTTSSKNNKTHEEIKAFWTQENRDAAIPKPFPEPPELGEVSFPTPKSPIITPPNTSIKDINRDQEVKVGLAIPVNSPKKYPWSCNGKLFFTWKGQKYVGSASSILNEVLLTAGHNIYDEGEWSDDFYYHPAYPDYHKRWSWTRAAIFTAWKNTSNFAYDYAMILTNTSMAEVGSIGCARDINPKGRTWTAIGYPSKYPYPDPGNQMYKTTGNYVSGSSIITMENNDMTKGSSGGAWLTQIGSENYVNGVQSTRGGAASYANSPYIDNDDYLNLLKCVETDLCE